MNHPGTNLDIQILEGSLAPRYPVSVKELYCKKSVITEHGMKSGLPLVDFQLVDAQGNSYFFVLTGRLVIALGQAVTGVIAKNEGGASGKPDVH